MRGRHLAKNRTKAKTYEAEVAQAIRVEARQRMNGEYQGYTKDGSMWVATITVAEFDMEFDALTVTVS